MQGPVRDLDHNATTPLDRRVRAAMTAALDEDAGNPSSVHVRGQQARGRVEAARREVAAAVGAEPGEVIFTSGGTEANNLALLGCMRKLRTIRGRAATVVTSALEHPSVRAAADRLQEEGHRCLCVPCDGRGRISPEALAATLAQDDDVGLVSLAAANHELGNAYDIPALVAVTRERAAGALFHCDAVQALGKLPVDATAWGVDLLSVSAHKIYGPRGIGALIRRGSPPLQPLTCGGAQERGLRPGTEATLLIAGFAVAARLAHTELEARARHVRALRARLVHGLAGQQVHVHGDPERHTGNTALVECSGCDGQLVMIALDLEGLCVSTGAACSSGTLEPSAALLAAGLPPSRARAGVRISLGKGSTEADVDALLTALPKVLARLRSAG